jgi:hypothetical protein
LPLLEKVRVEIFIPDLPDPAYDSILEVLGDELAYSFGGCTIISSTGKYRTSDGAIIPDKIHILFSDTQFVWARDRLLLESYAERARTVVKRALAREESILVAVFPVFHEA